MALGLIQFLVGGKKKKAVSKKGQVSVPVSNQAPAQQNSSVQIPNGVDQPTQNATPAANPEQASPQPQQQTPTQPSPQPQAVMGGSAGGKKSISEALLKIHNEMKDSNERLTGLVTDVKSLETSMNSLTGRIEGLEKRSSVFDEKFHEIDNNMSKFLSLYELINNQYNPFVQKEEMPSVSMAPPVEEPAEEETLEDNSNGLELEQAPEEKSVFGLDENSGLNIPEIKKPVAEPTPQPMPVKKEVKTITIPNGQEGFSRSLLELDTLDIEEAAADAVPLTKLKNNTNSLVIILSWMEYLIKKVGLEETRNTLRYYTETLRWLTPEVFFDLDKYLRGMHDVEMVHRNQANVKDHIVSLYFISKLNEKSLDHRLTKAVLDIIQDN